METIASIIKERMELKAEMERKKKEYDDFVITSNCKLNFLANKENLLSHSIDLEKFMRGQRLLDVELPCRQDWYTKHRTYSMIKSDIINDAKNDIVNGAKILKKQYFGQKQYEGYDQRCDCEYGMGPRHGSIYQKVGLAHPKAELSDEDIESCLYYLNNMEIYVENRNKNQ